MRLRKRNAASDHELTKHCHVLLERLPESELPMLENKTAKRMGRKRNGEELKHHLPSTSKRGRGRPSAQTASKLETPPKQEEIMANKTDSKAHIPRDTRHSRQGNERIKHFATSNRFQNQLPKVENETTTEISRHKGKVPVRDDRSIEVENEEKPGFSMHFQKEGTKSVKSEDGQTTSKSFVRFGHMSYFYVSLFKNYLYALSVNENNMNFEILERNLKKELIILNEKCENVVNKSLVKWILEISLNVKEVSLEDQWGTVKNAAMEAEREVLIECQKSKHKNKMPRKRMAHGSFYFFPPKTPQLSPSAFDEAAKPINDGASTSTTEIYNERGHFQVSSREANVNSSKTPIKSPLLEENTSTVEAIDTNQYQSEVPTSEREAETSSNLQSSIMMLVSDIVKEVSLEDQWGTVKNAAMEAEREVLTECQESKHKNKMPRKRMAEDSLYFLPPKTPKLSPSAFVEAAKPIDDGASTSTKKICNEREREHFQISSGEENGNSPKTPIKAPLLEEITSTVEAIDTNQCGVPTSEREAATSSNLQSSILRPVNDIASQHLEQEHNATPLPDDGGITNLLVDQVPKSIETKVFVENIEKCDKIQKPSNEYNNDIDLKGDGQQKSLCTTQKLDTTSVLETEKFLETLEEQNIQKPLIEYDNDINLETSKQQESVCTVQNIDRTTDLVVKEALLSNEIDKTRKSSSECDIYLEYTEQQESLSDSEKAQKTFSPTNLVTSDEKIKENCDLSMLVDTHETSEHSEEKQKLFLASDIEEKTSSLIENSISNNMSDSLHIENNKPTNSSELCISKGEEIDAKPSHVPGEDNVIKTLLDECIQLAENQDVIPHAEHNEASLTEIEIRYDVESPCPAVDLGFSQETEEARDSSLENVSTAGENSLYVNSSATDEEIFQLINEVLENVVSVIETETCYDPNSVLPSSTSDMASNHNNAEGNPNISMRVNSPDEEARHLVNETLENMVSLMKTQTLGDSVFPCSVSSLESNPVYAEEERASSLTNVSTSGSTSLPVNSSTDGDESLELLIIKTPENAVSVTETTLCYEAHTFPPLISDMGSVHDTTEENRDSLPADVSTLVNSPSVDSSMDGDKLSELINDISQKVVCVTETKTYFDIVSPNLTSDLESVPNTAEENDSSSPAVVSTPDERPNDDNKILFEDSTSTVSPLLSEERKEISSIENVSAGDEGICRDIMEEVIKGIENCCTDIQRNENTTFDKIPDDSSKIVSVVKEEDHELAEKDFTFMNGSDEKDEPKYHETRMFANHNKINCDEHRSQVYEVISDGEKEEDNAWAEEEFLSSKSDLNSLTFIRPEIPEGVYILRSDCLGYLNKLRHTNDDKSGFRSDYSVYCSEDGNRIAQESKLRDLAKELKDKMRKKPTKNSAHKWRNEKKNIFSWSGFDIDF
ncbi:hypothetical protein AVEN_150685-1 [Araneus ventricosus]|uniref:Uncharacterized protein n=1 Tax=Araneus ventricosus TaxID=182803 RepID=A0A4Y2WBR2_ARAVE|nr:hypothetical protein AVEN_150685-1 [Araneus ventricosus]